MAVIAAVGLACLLVGLAIGHWLLPNRGFVARNRPASVRRILLPFTGEEISRRALEAAVRLARAENAIIMPAFLARVPMDLPLNTPLPHQCARGMPLMEAIDQRVSALGLPVDSRIARGRSARDALRQLLAEEHFDRIIISAGEDPRTGISYDDLKWMLERVPAEVMILRPAPDDTRRISASSIAGHF